MSCRILLTMRSVSWAGFSLSMFLWNCFVCVFMLFGYWLLVIGYWFTDNGLRLTAYGSMNALDGYAG